VVVVPGFANQGFCDPCVRRVEDSSCEPVASVSPTNQPLTKKEPATRQTPFFWSNRQKWFVASRLEFPQDPAEITPARASP
jgi:hypothetical protein